MAGITLAIAEERLTAYLTAESKVLSNQSYEISGRRMTRADLAEIRAGIEVWDQRVKQLTEKAAGRSRTVNLSAKW